MFSLLNIWFLLKILIDRFILLILREFFINMLKILLLILNLAWIHNLLLLLNLLMLTENFWIDFLFSKSLVEDFDLWVRFFIFFQIVFLMFLSFQWVFFEQSLWVVLSWVNVSYILVKNLFLIITIVLIFHQYHFLFFFIPNFYFLVRLLANEIILWQVFVFIFLI